MHTERIRQKILTPPTFLRTVLFLFCLILAACAPASRVERKSSELTLQAEKTRAPGATKTPRRSPTPSPTAVPTSELGVDVEDLDGVEIQFWHPFSAEAEKALEALVIEFNADNEWGITIQSASLGDYDTLFEQVGSAVNHGEYPDLVVSYHYQAQAWENIREILVDLDAYVDDPVWGYTSAEVKDFYPVFWEHDQVDGRRIGIPALRSAQLVYYNTSWAEELGYKTPPTTPAQFKIQACAAAKANRQDADPQNDHTGGWIISTEYPAVLGWFNAFGAEVIQPDGKGYQLNSPETDSALTFLRELYEEGCAWLSDSQFPEDEFAVRRGLFAIGSLSGIPSQEDSFADLTSKDEWTVLPFPSPTNQAGIPVYGPSFQILETDPVKQLASWLAVKWLTSPENQARLAQASKMYPVRSASMEQLDRLTGTYPQWAKSVEFLDQAIPEPPYESWRIVRWAVSDAATQLFRSYFTIDQVPSLVKLLDRTANDLHKESSTSP
jgi:ABC-type glycerol-3-phosphate transport system substrate-binding protein